MKEDSYGSQLAAKIEKQLGGKVTKISDRTGLGRPDYQWLKNGIAVFIETKIGKSYEFAVDKWICYPWKEINDLRQFEVCKSYARHALVMYAIYYPLIKHAAVLPIEELQEYRVGLGGPPKPFFGMESGHGIQRIRAFSQLDRGQRHDELAAERGKLAESLSL